MSSEPQPMAGDIWDHTAIDAESRLLISLVPGKRTSENCEKLVEDVKRRTGHREDMFFTSDEHAPYVKAIEKSTLFYPKICLDFGEHFSSDNLGFWEVGFAYTLFARLSCK